MGASVTVAGSPDPAHTAEARHRRSVEQGLALAREFFALRRVATLTEFERAMELIPFPAMCDVMKQLNISQYTDGSSVTVSMEARR